MRDLIALIRALVTLIQPKQRGRHHRTGPRPFEAPTPPRAELLPAPEPIVMDGGDPRAYVLPRPYYTHWERERTARRERDQRGIELLIRMARPAPAFDDMAELRDLVRTAVAMGVGRS